MAAYGPFKIVLGGEGATGKTSLLKRVLNGVFTTDYQVTVGCDFAVLDLNFDETAMAKLICWDSGGQSRFACIRQAYYTGMSGFIILFDVTKRNSFERVREWYYELRSAAPNAPFVLVGNKIDLEEFREISKEEARDLAIEVGADYYIEISAKTGVDILVPFQTLAKLITRQKASIFRQTIPA
ncbi:MAG: Rab family GTPase [Candidatus Hodarchaeota archaeon]